MRKWTIRCLVFGVLSSGLLTAGVLSAATRTAEYRQAHQLHEEGNYQESLEHCRQLLQETSRSAEELTDCFNLALNCFRRLNRLDETDEFSEQIVAQHANQQLVLAAVAQSWLNGPHYGYRIGGEFRRGNHRGGGTVINATARDRVRALQLYWQAIQLLSRESSEQVSVELASLFEQMSEALMQGDGRS